MYYIPSMIQNVALNSLKHNEAYAGKKTAFETILLTLG